MAKKSCASVMRALHRDIGFLMVGLTLVFAFSGIVLVYRGTDFLKKERVIVQELEPGLDTSELRRELRLRGRTELVDEGDTITFPGGTYDKVSGKSEMAVKSLPPLVNRFNSLHQKSYRSKFHWISTVYAVLLLFLALSSFWMYKPATKPFWRGIILGAAGFIIAAVFLFI
ncbi:MAG: hypothetical protein JXR25_10625 [Pontiellaceae bacterium]|nr:hypothetical protein [Pontiellaceae bacterium]MBN2785274.1 hypothetical protein [Pontiellaceae bacterium]